LAFNGYCCLLCLIAIDYAKHDGGHKVNTNIDISNLKFYEDKEAEETMKRGGIVPQYAYHNQNQSQQPSVVNDITTKKQFIESKMNDIKKESPNLTDKQIYTRANMLWKNSRKK
jgi:hypothetical protein